MSTERGNTKKKAPRHQNTFAFKHNPKSKKTQKILATPIHGLCEKCHEKIVWRKKYRKYKPLTQPGNCIYCHQKNVTSAYHVACQGCAKERNICAKCCESKEIVPSEQELAASREAKAKALEENLEGLRERERRAALRKLDKEKRPDGGQDDQDGGLESYDEEEDDDLDMDEVDF